MIKKFSRRWTVPSGSSSGHGRSVQPPTSPRELPPRRPGRIDPEGVRPFCHRYRRGILGPSSLAEWRREASLRPKAMSRGQTSTKGLLLVAAPRRARRAPAFPTTSKHRSPWSVPGLERAHRGPTTDNLRWSKPVQADCWGTPTHLSGNRPILLGSI
jgi:hypothetical protein